MTAPAPPAVEIQGVTMRFEETVALDDVTLAIAAGSFVVLLGPPLGIRTGGAERIQDASPQP